jgi:hypothetical protein
MKSSLQNPFAEEWLECLLAHYRYIVQCQRHDVEATMRQLLASVGVPHERLVALGAPAQPSTSEQLLEAPAQASMPEQAVEPEQPPAPEAEPTVQAPSAAPAAREKKPPKQLSFF